ncbi:chemosensory pili system protein ChpC [Rhodanobacter sp. TND4EL1]
MSDPLPREIRCVLVPVGNQRLLLPNANIAEVITQSPPEPLAGAPAWLLGRIQWRGWRVPLVSFTELAGTEAGDAGLSVRVAVLKALGGNPKLPFIAILTQGFPRLTTLNAELIIPTHDGKELPPGVRAHVLVRDDVAMIPDMEWLEATLLDLYDDTGLTEPTEAAISDETMDTND